MNQAREVPRGTERLSASRDEGRSLLGDIPVGFRFRMVFGTFRLTSFFGPQPIRHSSLPCKRMPSIPSFTSAAMR